MRGQASEPTRKRAIFAASLMVAVVAVVAMGRGFVQSAIGLTGDAAPDGALRLRGMVRALDGQPIQGARVELFAVDEAHAFTPLGEARVAADASFSARVLPRSRLPGGGEHLLLVRASAPGHASESLAFDPEAFAAGTARAEQNDDMGAAQKIDLRLAAHPATLQVIVAAGAGQLPSAGASVLVTFDPVAAPRGALYAWRGRTDGEGVARFEDLPPLAGTLHVWAEDELGRVSRKVVKEPGPVTTEVRLALERGRAARVQLVATSPGDLTSAEVVLRELDGPWHVRLRPDAGGLVALPSVPVGVSLLAEVSGAWILADGAPARTWQVERASEATPAADEEEATAATAPVVAAAAAPAELTLRVSPGGVLSGVAVDERGAPVLGAVVTASPDRGDVGVPHRVTTDERGRFSLSGLSLATAWTLEARHHAHAPARAEAVDARTSDLRLQLHQGGALVGRVVDGKGRGVAGVEVYAHAMQRQAAGEHRTEARGLPEYTSIRTDDDGRYRLGRVNPGLYRFEVRPTARMQWSNVAAVVQEQEVRPGDNTIADIVIARGASLRGVAEVGAAGASSPSEAAAVAAMASLEVAILPDGQQGVPHRVAVQPDRQGRFTLDDLEPGSFRVRVRSRQRGWSEPALVSLREGEAAEASFLFASTASLEGKIALADGRAARNARIDLYRERGAERQGHDLSGNWANVAEDGSYRVTGLVPGSYTARITSDDAAPLVTLVKLADARTARTFTLERGHHVQVALRSSNGTTTANKVVVLEPTEAGGVSMQALSDADGVASFEKVPTGAYRARAVLPGMPSVSLHTRKLGARLTID